jgi:hyaluronan synthase
MLGRYLAYILKIDLAQLWPLAALWVPRFLSLCWQWTASWFDQPTQDYAPRLDRLALTVVIPCYNEDPGLLDRCLWALHRQTRLPQRIVVVNDGSSVDYRQLREHWTRIAPAETDSNTALAQDAIEVVWHDLQANVGKKHAQGVAFGSTPDTDVYVIIDSDTALAQDAIEEGLKPLASRSVASVAGIELAMNHKKNWLTCAASMRGRIFQYISCAAQSARGDVLINRGAFFLIRSAVVWEALPAYLNETLFGRPVRLGDDAALTLFARNRGKTVQQSTAFALTMYPETISHHLRQWVRWMRGSTIRNFWRIKYLSAATYGWWFTVLSVNGVFLGASYPVIIALTWPRSARPAAWLLLFMVVWGWVFALRGLCIRRSDETLGWLILSWLAYPVMTLWMLLVLRPVQWYGTATFLKQNWKTRAAGAEVTLDEGLKVAGTLAGGSMSMVAAPDDDETGDLTEVLAW